MSETDNVVRLTSKQQRRRDHFDDLGLSERDAWSARLRYVGTGDTSLEDAVEQMLEKFESVS